MKKSALASSKQNVYASLFIVASLFVFYPDLFLAQSASLMGDHWEQHYPWAFLLDGYVKNFKLPFWTTAIHSGFPIAAEGQIGVFYLPNLLLHFLLPLNWAYSYRNVLHFALSGIATFFYGRQMGLRLPGALISALIFIFGSAYGGAFYNITSLETIAWFPLSLLFF